MLVWSSSARPTGSKAPSSVKTLLVDDEQSLRDVIARRLRRAGHEVIEAKCAEQALDLFEQNADVAAVVSDICMSGVNGVELLRRLKARRNDVEVVLMTGYAEVETAVGAVDAHAFAYLRKPFCMEELIHTLDRLDEVLRMRRERAENARRLEGLVQRMEASDRRYRALVEGVRGAVLSTGADLRIRSAAGQTDHLFGRSSEELAGTSIDELRHPDDAERFRHVARELLDEGGVRQIDGDVIRADGRVIPTVEVLTAAGGCGDDGEEPGLFWILQDGTEEQRLKEQAEIARDYLAAMRRSRTEGRRLIGDSRGMRNVLRMIQSVAPTDASVLVLGASGTGKELVAESIHVNSPRADKPFVVVHCAALPESLLESELFGYEKGAFTGAVGCKRGLIEIADGGTLFVDEVGEIPASIQAKLLRVLEQGDFRRLGSTKDRTSDIRVIAATNRDLLEDVAAGRFRQDLLYRLDVVRIEIPPLAGRPEDVLLIAEDALRRKAGANGRPKRLSSTAREMLAAYDWPGNVRELLNVLERALILCGSADTIQSEHLSITPPSGCAPVQTLKELEEREIDKALAATSNNKTHAADLLGITRQTLISRLKRRRENGIRPPR
jgi:PAS domain S-box-containing protein